ncbi:MAG: FdtA/QdtA family cupin domain-containing protein [Rickettsiales bacterium]|nr:FdtA/QdtA family cupin domain-containing protein [Rickettsiales bacterium]
MTINIPKLVNINKVSSSSGSISFLEEKEIGFSVKRVYYIYDVPSGEYRGAHAHKELTQFFISLSGSFNLKLDDGLGNIFNFNLKYPYEGVFVPKGYWRELTDFTSGCTCLVLASQPYYENDYIRDYKQFCEYKKSI